MTNFLEETIEAIERSGHKISDIYFIGSLDGAYECTWNEFSSLADFEYHSGFGGQEVVKDILIVFNDGQTMTRGEHDGSEWWQYSKPFKKQETTIPIKRLIAVEEKIGWYSIEEIND